MANCRRCLHIECCERNAEANGAVLDHLYADECELFRRAYGAPTTRADGIRAMSVQELAEFICGLFGDSCCDDKETCPCPGFDLCKFGDGRANGLVKWLSQPYDEG